MSRRFYCAGPVNPTRFLLGPVLVLALVGVFWLDERLDGSALPGWLGWLPGAEPTFPPGTVLLPIGLVLCVLAARELARIFRAGNVVVPVWWMGLCAAGGLLVWAFVPARGGAVDAVGVVSAAATLVLVGTVLQQARHRQVKGATAAVGAALFAFVYVGLMFGFLLALRRESSAWLVFGVLLTTKSCDIGAYLTGHAIGRHKLIAWLSPGKTWEGLVGGVVTSAVTALVLLEVVGTWGSGLDGSVGGMEIWEVLAIGAAFGLVGQLGDLVASLLKRDAGIKDSGSSVPGFGGVLDVLDSVLLVAPLAYWTLRDVW